MRGGDTDRARRRPAGRGRGADAGRDRGRRAAAGAAGDPGAGRGLPRAVRSGGPDEPAQRPAQPPPHRRDRGRADGGPGPGERHVGGERVHVGVVRPADRQDPRRRLHRPERQLHAVHPADRRPGGGDRGHRAGRTAAAHPDRAAAARRQTGGDGRVRVRRRARRRRAHRLRARRLGGGARRRAPRHGRDVRPGPRGAAGQCAPGGLPGRAPGAADGRRAHRTGLHRGLRQPGRCLLRPRHTGAVRARRPGLRALRRRRAGHPAAGPAAPAGADARAVPAGPAAQPDRLQEAGPRPDRRAAVPGVRAAGAGDRHRRARRGQHARAVGGGAHPGDRAAARDRAGAAAAAADDPAGVGGDRGVRRGARAGAGAGVGRVHATGAGAARVDGVRDPLGDDRGGGGRLRGGGDRGRAAARAAGLPDERAGGDRPRVTVRPTARQRT
ncbi:hypothetical protein SGPA1_20638 [Streptomyces misionensis JCM 4497]